MVWVAKNYSTDFSKFGGKVKRMLRKKPLDFNQSINQFITRHSSRPTEARATMSLSQTEKEYRKSVLENINGWSSRTAQWKRVPESWFRDRETTSSNVAIVCVWGGASRSQVERIEEISTGGGLPSPTAFIPERYLICFCIIMYFYSYRCISMIYVTDLLTFCYLVNKCIY